MEGGSEAHNLSSSQDVTPSPHSPHDRGTKQAEKRLAKATEDHSRSLHSSSQRVTTSPHDKGSKADRHTEKRAAKAAEDHSRSLHS